jgi:signal transduction histidine kinase
MFIRIHSYRPLREAGVLLIATWLILAGLNPQRAHGSIEGLYVGQDFYAPGIATQEAARSSGFTRLFLFALHVNTNGDISFNNILLIQNGIYIGDPTWAVTLAALKVQPTSVDRIEAVIGGTNDMSFANIKDLLASQGTGTNSILYQDLLVLKNATGVDAIQLDDEQTYDVATTVSFGRMIAGLGMKISLHPYTAPDFWVKIKSQLGEDVDAVYLSCYGNGEGNEPAVWNHAFGGFKVYPGLWGGSPDNPLSITTKFRNWQNTLGITGGFLWLQGYMPDDAPRWAQALSFGLDSLPSFRIVNKNSGKSLGVLDGVTSSSINAQFNYATSGDQQWSLAPTEDGSHYKIISWASDKCVSIALNSMQPGARVWLWDYNSDPSQQFDLVDAGDGWFKIKNARSKLFLSVVGGSMENGAEVEQNVDSESPDRLWKLYPYREATAMLAYDNVDCPVTDLNGQNGGRGWNGGWSDISDFAARRSLEILNGPSNASPRSDGRSHAVQAALPPMKQLGRYLDCSVNGNFGVYGYLDSDGCIGADGTTLYISFLQVPAKNSQFHRLELYRGVQRVASIGNDPDTNVINFSVTNETGARFDRKNTSSDFYVVRIDFKPGNDDVRVYRNPKSDSEPAKPGLTRISAADLSFNRISMIGDNSIKNVQIRLANSWQYAIGAAPEFVTQPSSNIVSDDIFRHVRVCGQVLYGNGKSYVLLDGSTGLRVMLNQPMNFEPGDMLDVMGLVQRKNQFVELIEVTARKTSHLPLPQPVPLDTTGVVPEKPWIWVEGVLAGFKDEGTEQTLEMQDGLKKFVARMRSIPGKSLDYSLGSRLKLTGVYIKPIGAPASGESSDSFELLLNSPAAIKLIARPPWWTFKRVMFVVAILGGGLILAFLWISQLRWQVKLRTVELRRENSARQQVEQKRLVEEERARIARDIHDELGSKLTRINMLAVSGPGPKIKPDSMRMQQISETARSLLISLDRVVWAVNPENDTLSSLVIYMAAYAEEFLANTNIACRVHALESCPAIIVAADLRNNLLLSVKEAINNAVSHGHPDLVSLTFLMRENWLEVQIHDNGCGFDTARSFPGNGLKNLLARMHKIGGFCEIQSSAANGTTILLTAPLAKVADSASPSNP